MARPRRVAASRTRKRIARISSKTRAEDSSDSDYQYDEGNEEDVPLEAERAKKKFAQRPIRSISSVTDVSQSSVSNDDSEYESLESNLDSGDAFNSDVSEEEIIEKVARAASKKTSRSRKCRKKLKSDDKKKLEWEKWEEELSNWCPWGDDDDDFDMDAVVQKDFPQPEMEPSSDLLMPLLPFQKEWLAWSLKQEESTTRGGILADEMGMGKTIQAISLILTSKELACGHHIDSSEVLSTELAKKLSEIKATLVVCPLIAVTQWENEISKFTKEGSLKVLIYHGARKNINIQQLADYDVVLTTYSTVESEHRRFVRPPKEKCKWCGKLFLPDRIGLHLRYFCGPTAQKSEKQSKQVRKNKTNSAHKGKKANYAKNALKNSEETVYKGSGDENRTRKRKSVSEAFSLDDLHESNLKPGGNENASETVKASSLLHSVKWLRIILDEAHSIKDRTCSTAKAIFAMKSSYKWALSGTPLQNRVGELYSLVRFLEISPYSYYFCRKCDCKSLDYNFRNGFRTCETCQHGPLLHFSWWNKFVANPIKRWGYVHRGRKALMLLKYKVLEATLLRRTKTERAADLTLPPRTTFLRRDAFDPREEDFYQALYTQSQSQFNTYVTSGTLLNNYAHIFDLLTRLRQAVDHPYLVVYSATAGSSIIQSQRSLNSTAVEENCGICHDPVDDPVSTACGHLFCKSCIEEYTAAVGSIEDDEHGPQCPTCQKALTIDLTKNHSSQKELAGKLTGRKRSSILHRIDLKRFQTCTKIEALKEEIMLMLEKDGAAKAIVFSQFTSMLELIGYSLQTAGFQCVKLDGSMSMAARDQMIEKFRNDPGCKVFLMSLKAGGVALNLTVASHVFLMDPWWNPAVEKQAQDRIHRIGQYKPIRVIRFVIENTIEERILKLQEKKQLVFEGTVGGSSEALGRLTEEDLRFLFHS